VEFSQGLAFNTLGKNGCFPICSSLPLPPSPAAGEGPGEEVLPFWGRLQRGKQNVKILFQQPLVEAREHMSASLSANGSKLTIRPVAGRIGAEVNGVRLWGDLDSRTVDAIRDALHRFKVLFFRGQQHLDEFGQEAFGKLFGNLVPHPTIPSLRGTQHVLDVDGAEARASSWHTDVTFVDAYPQISILRAQVVPQFGGDTVWANTAAAYQSLSPSLRELADNLWAIHSNRSEYAGYRPTGKPEPLKRYYEVFTSTVYETEHPVVRVHPVTGERTLVLGYFVQKILGVSSADSAHLFALFQGHVTRLENTVRWRWSVGDVAMWDNRATQHTAIDDYGDEPRILRRVTVAGDVPVSVKGKTSVLRRKFSLPPPEIGADVTTATDLRHNR
jgi:alpha-ketoglutarate-dependent sulfate ester dioxygenase